MSLSIPSWTLADTDSEKQVVICVHATSVMCEIGCPLRILLPLKECLMDWWSCCNEWWVVYAYRCFLLLFTHTLSPWTCIDLSKYFNSHEDTETHTNTNKTKWLPVDQQSLTAESRKNGGDVFPGGFSPWEKGVAGVSWCIKTLRYSFCPPSDRGERVRFVQNQ